MVLGGMVRIGCMPLYFVREGSYGISSLWSNINMMILVWPSLVARHANVLLLGWIVCLFGGQVMLLFILRICLGRVICILCLICVSCIGQVRGAEKYECVI